MNVNKTKAAVEKLYQDTKYQQTNDKIKLENDERPRAELKWFGLIYEI